MTNTLTDVVRDFYARLAAGDAPGALALMASDIEWITMWHYKVEGRGPSAVAEGLFKPLMAEWTSFSLIPAEFITEGETVVSLGDFKGIHGATGKTCEARYAHVWAIEERKIVRFRQYIDTLAIAEARIGWLMAIIQLRGIDPHRRRARVAQCKPTAAALESSGGAETHVSDIIDADDRAERPQNAVRAPPRRQRTAMELVKLSKLLTAESAFRTRQSLGAIKIIVHRGLQALRRLLRENPR